MIEEKNDSKKILLSVIGVAILIVAVVGISFAVANLTETSGENSIQTGTITMSYSEPEKGINLVNAVPISDEVGKAMAHEEGAANNMYFQFVVNTSASGDITIPYEINLSEKAVDDPTKKLDKSKVKVYLSKVEDDGSETEVVAPVLLSTLSASTARPGAFILKSVENVHNSDATRSITTTYRFRMWVDSAATDYDDKTYKLLVNVESKVNALGVNS